jgi:hypothetical protein
LSNNEQILKAIYAGHLRRKLRGARQHKASAQIASRPAELVSLKVKNDPYIQKELLNQ